MTLFLDYISLMCWMLLAIIVVLFVAFIVDIAIHGCHY